MVHYLLEYGFIEDFKFRAFVSVDRNPDLQKVLQMILIELDKKRYMQFNFAAFQDINQFIKELREFLRGNKRYASPSHIQLSGFRFALLF